MQSFSTLLALAVAAFICSPSLADPLYKSFRDPPAPNRPFVRWWWNGGRVNLQEIVRELDVLRAAGIGGVEINTIGMPPAVPPSTLAGHPEVTWLSPEWIELVRATAEAARQRGLTVDLIVGSGWPMGGRFLDPAEQTQRVRLVKRTVRGPQLLALARADLLAPITPPRNADASEDDPPPTRSELLALRLSRSDALSSAFAAGRDLLPELAQRDAATIDVPDGGFVLHAVVQETGFTHVKLGAPGADGPVLDHFNASAVRKYLARMSAQLAPAFGGRLGDGIRAMFIDSLELDHANWTTDLREQFHQRRGYDLTPYLPFILDPDLRTASGAAGLTLRRAHYDFCRTLVELFHERFLATYNEWCHANGLKSRIQAYGRETHPLHGSMEIDLPEGETWLWVHRHDPERIRIDSTVVNKYVASAANLSGQRLRSFEAMTNPVPVFRATLEDFKRAFDTTLVDGLNHPIIHGFNYSPPEAGFPGWLRFGSYLNEQNPWWPYFRQFTDYAARLGTVMRASETAARIAVLAPRADEWARHGLLYQPFPEVADPWYQFELIGAIQQAGYNADYVSARILAHADIRDGRLRYGPCAYDLLVVIAGESLEPEAAEAIADFGKHGGSILFVGEPPGRAPGLQDAERNDARVRNAIARIREAGSPRVHHAAAPAKPDGNREGTEEEVLLQFVGPLLARVNVTPEVVFDQPDWRIRQISGRTGERRVYFIANTDPLAPSDVLASFPGAAGSPYQWDPHTGDRQPLALEPDGRLRLLLEPAGSALIVFAPDEKPTTAVRRLPEGRLTYMAAVNSPWRVRLLPAGAGSETSRTLPQLVDFSRQEDDDALRYFGGVAIYETEFAGVDISDACLDLGAVHGVSEVSVNGTPLGSRWWGRHRYSLDGAMRPGTNRLEVKVSTVLVNLMQHKKDDPVAQRWAHWAPPIPAGLVGPVRLLGKAHDKSAH